MAMAQTVLDWGELQVPEAPDQHRDQWDLSVTAEEAAYRLVEPTIPGRVEDVGPRAVNIRAAAARLGVHENTIRNWVDRGILQAIRLPGSSFRRIPVSDLQRLALEMAGQHATPALAGGPDVEAHRSTGKHLGVGFQGQEHEGW
jgi:excisionase family DNA binding protein